MYSSKPGRELLRQWLIRPVNSKELIEDRLDTIEFLLDIKNSELRSALSTAVKAMHDTERIVNRIQSMRSSVTDWQNL
jgi:DNA mismatch repair ATPase MutS